MIFSELQKSVDLGGGGKGGHLLFRPTFFRSVTKVLGENCSFTLSYLYVF